jgi:hypothetical protein
VPKASKGVLRASGTFGTALHRNLAARSTSKSVKPILVEVQRPSCLDSLCQVSYRRLHGGTCQPRDPLFELGVILEGELGVGEDLVAYVFLVARTRDRVCQASLRRGM